VPFAAATLTRLDHGIVAVDTDYVRPILDASHLVMDGGRAAFVDTGTNHSVPLLLDALRQLDVDVADVDYLFLTHVHLDHAGGAGELLKHLPNATAVVHPRGAPHLAEPDRLVRGTVAVYGQAHFDKVYQGVTPISRKRITAVEDGQVFRLGNRDLTLFFTEGHARHHYCVHDPASAGVFAGDSFGVSYRELDTANGEFIFPSSTPIDFDPPEAHKSVDRIMACEPARVYLTHFSQVTDLGRLADDLHEGIDFYADLAMRSASRPNRAAAISEGLFSNYRSRLEGHGYRGDVAAMHAVLDFDVRLNTMGLEVWLDRNARR